MNFLFFVFKFAHYSICIGLIFIVLLQAKKSGGIGGIFGVGGGSDQIFNASSGMAFVKKMTIIMACIFLFTSLMLTKLSTNISMTSIISRLPSIPTEDSVKTR
ncbi:MAG: preprotein translocase subunit SecG [Endomicrobium sp.]|jgi:preprotein translocase subunit SecG|nr:preprotein translocase subunit SecG [Endomicrobium sp.]